ncbi:hypothetical protein [Methylobacterium sp. SyP6R]|uniref:hypothetical protein n=1 Tax=Methylobacterium sp. SyP6R TaxID=2718876 RepID=UPI001F43C7D4|nr:hypothetical protein [Methylobacterium sp. SyP6R]MCF4129850.1 hypothetical protein [Methylobacterium sp. SyP6R]
MILADVLSCLIEGRALLRIAVGRAVHSDVQDFFADKEFAADEAPPSRAMKR